MNNIDYAKKWFPKTFIDINNEYYLCADGFTIELLQDNCFTINRTYLDLEIGYVTDTDIFNGNFIECIEYIKKDMGIE